MLGTPLHPCRSVRSLRQTRARVGGLILLAEWVLLPCSIALGQNPAEKPQDGAVPRSTAAPASARRVPEGLNFANGLFRQRRYDLAAKEYQRFLEIAKPGEETIEARFGLANARLFQGDYAKARIEFEDFLRAAPEHTNAPTALYRIGETAYMLGDLAGARKAFETYTAENPNHKHVDTAWPYLGDVCLRIGDASKARDAYETSLKINPKGKLASRARFGLGRALALLGKLDEALAEFKTLAEQGGKDWADRAWYQTGQTEVMAGRDEKALEAFLEVERVAPESPVVNEARLNRAETLARLGRDQEAEPILKGLAADAPPNLGAQAAFLLGTTQLEKGDPQVALGTLDDASAKFSKTKLAAALQFRSAEALLKLGKLDDARTRFLRAAEADPKDPWADDALLRACRIALDQERRDDIPQLVKTFEEKFPDSPLLADVHLVAARSSLAGGLAKDAIATLTALLDHDQPTEKTAENARFYLSRAYQADGQADKAAELLEGLAKNPTAGVGADAQFLVAQGLMEAKQFDKAVPALEAYLAAHPDGEEADFALAHLIQAKAALDDREGASKALEQLAKNFPKSTTLAASRVRVAEAEAKAKQFDRAIEQYKLAIESGEPAVVSRAKLGLGWVLADAQKPAEAAAAFDEFIKANPQDPLALDARLAQAKALEAAGQLDAAIAAYAMVADLAPKSENADIAGLSRARLLVDAKRPADAALVYERFVADHPGYAPKGSGPPLDVILSEWGWALIDADKPAEADQVFRRLLDEFPQSPHADDARFNLAESANQSKKSDEVVKLLEPIVAENSKAAPRLIQASLYRLGRTFSEKKDWEAAAKVIDRLLDQYKDSTLRREASLLRGEIALEQGDPAKADATFKGLADEPALPSDPPGFALALGRRRIQSLLGLKQWNDVIAAADKLKADAPDDPLVSEADYAKGRALQQMARWDEARAAYLAVIESRKGGALVAMAQLMIGETYFHQKDYHEAIRQFLKVDILYDAPPWQAAALLETGKAYEKLAQWADAAESYQRALQLPENASTAEAKTRLEALKGKKVEGIAAEPTGKEKS